MMVSFLTLCVVGLVSATVEEFPEYPEYEPSPRCPNFCCGDNPCCGGSRPTGKQFAGRSPTRSRYGAVASVQPLASEAGISILKMGGHAVEAAIATNAVLGLVEPMSCGMGGDLMAFVWEQPENKLYGMNGAGRAAGNFSYEEMKNESYQIKGAYVIPSQGPLGVTVPGAVRGWCDLHAKFGKLPFKEMFQPAINYARNGFPVTDTIAYYWNTTYQVNYTEATSNGRYPRAADNYLETLMIPEVMPDGTTRLRAPKVGEIFMNRDLADSYEALANEGCDAYYHPNGTIAKKLLDFREVGGIKWNETDLLFTHSEWVTPINTTYRDQIRVFELPPNPAGAIVLQSLNILENFNISRMGLNSADATHINIETKKLTFADAAQFYADPEFAYVPIEGLLSKEYAKRRARLINPLRAAKTVEPGRPPSCRENEPFYKAGLPWLGDTTYISAASADGTMVSLIQSVFDNFGSHLIAPGTGFILQNRGGLFSLEEGHANQYKPYKRPFHTIMPGFATKIDQETKEESPWLVFGVKGSFMQPQGQVQAIQNIIDHGLNVQEAGDAGRWFHVGGEPPDPASINMTDGGYTQLEAGFCDATVLNLELRGHNITRGFNQGGYEAIMREPAQYGDGPGYVFSGATEMRKDGQVAVY